MPLCCKHPAMWWPGQAQEREKALGVKREGKPRGKLSPSISAARVGVLLLLYWDRCLNELSFAGRGGRDLQWRHTHTQTHTQTPTHTFTHIHIHVRAHTWTHRDKNNTYTHTHMHIHAHTCAHTQHMHLHAHIYTHMYTHAHTLTHTRLMVDRAPNRRLTRYSSPQPFGSGDQFHARQFFRRQLGGLFGGWFKHITFIVHFISTLLYQLHFRSSVWEN